MIGVDSYEKVALIEKVNPTWSDLSIHLSP